MPVESARIDSDAFGALASVRIPGRIIFAFFFSAQPISVNWLTSIRARVRVFRRLTRDESWGILGVLNKEVDSMYDPKREKPHGAGSGNARKHRDFSC